MAGTQRKLLTKDLSASKIYFSDNIWNHGKAHSLMSEDAEEWYPQNMQYTLCTPSVLGL